MTICSRCGGYSQLCARLLGRPCSGQATSTRRSWIKRVFERGLHPVEDRATPVPIFWRQCAPQQVSEVGGRVAEAETQAEPALSPLAKLFEYSSRLISDEDCKVRGYGASEADAKKYAEAVVGGAAEEDKNGEKVSKVGTSCTSSDPDHWEPWNGMRVNHPITKGPTVPTGSKLRNRFCFNPAERERRQFDSRRAAAAAETILHDTYSGDHLQDVLPAINGFSCHTRGEAGGQPPSSLVENSWGTAPLYDSHDLRYNNEADSDEDLLDELATDAIADHFWKNLEDTPLDDRRIPVGRAQVQGILNDFTLFAHTPDEQGLNEAILDILQMIEEGQVTDPDACLLAIENSSMLLEPRSEFADVQSVSLPTDLYSVPEHMPVVSPASPASNYECEIPCGDDGLPTEDTVSFLFDGVSNDVVTSRAVNEPAYRRLAALRERVLARLNLPNG